MSSPDQTTVRGKGRLALLLALATTLAITLAPAALMAPCAAAVDAPSAYTTTNSESVAC